MLECVLNLSEGRDRAMVELLARTAGDALLDIHSDADHHRSVLTMIGVGAPRAVTEAAVAHLDLRSHRGVHPRIGVVDVVPFVPLAGATIADAITARDDYARWAGEELGVPCFLYGALPDGSTRSLPTVRRGAFSALSPDSGPSSPHPTAGAIAVGARGPLVAFNVWLADADLATAQTIASQIRGPHLRALGLLAGGCAQVAMNLIHPDTLGPAQAYDLVAARATVARAELVGLVPSAVLAAIDPTRWYKLDLGDDRTIESRIERAGRRGR